MEDEKERIMVKKEGGGNKGKPHMPPSEYWLSHEK